MAAGYDDLLLFKTPGSEVAFFDTNNGAILELAQPTQWSLGVTQVIPGNFARTFDNGGTQLLLYNATTGTAQFCSVASGMISPFSFHQGWRTTWTHIIPGRFGGTDGSDRLSDILFYDAAAGYAEFYTIQDNGAITLLSSHSGWLKTWTHIIPGDFGSGPANTDLLFYDATRGLGDFYSVRNGHLSAVLSSNGGWRTSWKQIVAGNFGSGSGNSDLLFYDAGAGTGEFYSVKNGKLAALLSSNVGWRTNWTNIAAGQFGGSADTDLVFYDSAAGDIAIYTVDNAILTEIGARLGWSSGWTEIFSGHYSQQKPLAAPTDLEVIFAQSNSVTISWKDNSQNETGFMVHFNGKGTSPIHHIGTQTVPANTTKTVVEGLYRNYEYSLFVQAFNATGVSGNSNEVQASTGLQRILV